LVEERDIVRLDAEFAVQAKVKFDGVAGRFADKTLRLPHGFGNGVIFVKHASAAKCNILRHG
jgi:hypothetical protein